MERFLAKYDAKSTEEDLSKSLMTRESNSSHAYCFITSAQCKISGPRYLYKDEEILWMESPTSSVPIFTTQPSTSILSRIFHLGKKREIRQVISVRPNVGEDTICLTIKRKGNFRIQVENQLLTPAENNNEAIVEFKRKLDVWIDGHCVTLRNCKNETIIPERIFKQYDLISDLASSKNSSVYKIQDKNNRGFAVLKVERSIGLRDRGMVNEIEILRKISHENIISIISADTDPRKHHLITPFATGGDLSSLIGTNRMAYEPQAHTIFKQVVSAIAYLHQNRIAHLDIKPGNILLMDDSLDKVKIIDFGVSRNISACGTMTSACGTFNFMSPIVMSNYLLNSKRPYTEKTDIWSLGVCMYVFLTQEFPFASPYGYNYEYYQQVTRGVIRTSPLMFRRLSAPLKKVIIDCLQVHERNRPTAARLLQHYVWFSESRASQSFPCPHCNVVCNSQRSLLHHQYLYCDCVDLDVAFDLRHNN